MAIENLTDLTDFIDNYEIKNGTIADSADLNLAVHRVQQELIALWNFVRLGNSSIDSTKFLINDDLSDTTTADAVRSIAGVHNETFYGGTW